jgi:V/A-type H+-transporting ATPase subunit E
VADLAALLDKEASAEIESIRSEAQERASEIVAEAEEEAEQLVAKRERAAKQQRDAALVRARSSAELEAASMRLKAQQQAIESVFDEARDRIDALVSNRETYAPVLKTLLQQAIAGLDSKADMTVVVNPDESSVAKEVVDELDLQVEVSTDDQLRGGVRLKAAKGSNSIENTLVGRLDALRDDLASEVSEVLLQKGS